MAIIVVGVAVFWFGLRATLRTDHPLLAVISGSMLPTLNVGDYILLQGVNADEIKAENIVGDIIVFPSPTKPGELIVHRAVGKDHEGYFITRGDNNPTTDGWRIPGNEIIGKVIGRIPYIGNTSLFFHTQQGTYLYIIIFFFMILLILIDFIIPSEKEEKDKASKVEKNVGKRKLIERILEGRVVFLVILNVLLISLAIFSLWSSFTFWQPGADPPQYVTIRGMYADLQFHEHFKAPSDLQSHDAVLHQSLITYKIDCLVNGVMRPGVSTVSWTQFLILLLLVIDAWMLIDSMWSRRNTETDE
jgi:signal peptidase I